MFRKISSTFIVIVFSMLSSFIATIYMGRYLSIREFGNFTLFKQLITTGSAIATLGLAYSYTKNFSKEGTGKIYLHWITFFISFIMSNFVGILIWRVYHLTIVQTYLIIFSIWFGALSIYTAANFRIKEHYLGAQFIQSGWKILFLGVVLVAINLKFNINLTFLILFFLISLTIPALSIFSIMLQPRNIESETKVNIKTLLTFGLLFWLLDSTSLISGAIDKFLIPLVYSKQILGIYSALSFIYVTTFLMIGSAIGYVLFPTISKGQSVNWRKMIAMILLIIIGASIVFLFFGKNLIRVVYEGKYDIFNGWFFILCFIIIGIIQMVHTITHFIIAAKGSRKLLRYYFGWTLIGIGLFIFLVYGTNYYGYGTLKTLTISVLIVRITKISGMLLMVYLVYRGNRSKNNQTTAYPQIL